MRIMFFLTFIVASQSFCSELYKNVVWDFGGVIIEGGVQSIVAQMRQEDSAVDEQLSTVTNTEHWKQWDNGFITVQTLIDELSKKYNREHVTKVLERLMSSSRPFSNECLDIIKLLVNRGYKLFILSNLSKEMHERAIVSNPEIFKVFTAMIFSFQSKLSKPAAEAYTELLKSCDLKAEETLFVDDSLKNVAAAIKVGIAGVHYEQGTLRERLALAGIALS
jgi:FMN phosphatase YigB (HAD superfamily)